MHLFEPPVFFGPLYLLNKIQYFFTNFDSLLFLLIIQTTLRKTEITCPGNSLFRRLSFSGREGRKGKKKHEKRKIEEARGTTRRAPRAFTCSHFPARTKTVKRPLRWRESQYFLTVIKTHIVIIMGDLVIYECNFFDSSMEILKIRPLLSSCVLTILWIAWVCES